MGLDNRGRWYRWNKRKTVDDYLKLDMVALANEIDFTRSCFASLAWTTKTYAGEWESSIGMRVIPYQGIQLHYSHNGETVKPYIVPIVSTTPNYGGKRYWFLCPNQHCRRRVRILYGGKYFLCRHCRDLTYPVCQKASTEALELSISNRMWWIRDKLQAAGGLRDPLPEKPPRMHWNTYERLIGEYDELRDLHLAALMQGFTDLVDDEEMVFVRSYPAHQEWEEHKRRRREEPDTYRMHALGKAVAIWESGLWTEESEQAGKPNRLTLGQLAKGAGVPYAFAREAVDEGLLRPDQGRSTRRQRYRRRLTNWLSKLYTLRSAGMTWSGIRAWTERRWSPGHEQERKWPEGYVHGRSANDATRSV